MKKIILSLTGLLLLAIGLNAQSIQLFAEGVQIENGSEISVTISPFHDPDEFTLQVYNSSSNGMQVNVRKADLTLVQGAYSNICWGVQCYPYWVYETPESVRLDAGETDYSFRGDYSHFGNLGSSRVLFTFFDISNTADSSWFIVNYNVVEVAEKSFEATYNGSLITNGQVISALFEPVQDTAKFELQIKNVNSAPVYSRVKRYFESVLPVNTEANICWGSDCYPSDINVTSIPVMIDVNGTENSFSGNFIHNGIQESTRIRYTFFDSGRPSDSISFIVNYTVGYLGIGETNTSLSTISNAYPNPASGNVNFDYQLPASAKNAEIKVTNLLGTVIEEIILDKTEGKASLNVSNLKNGIYFYSLMINNFATTTRKFVVKR